MFDTESRQGSGSMSVWAFRQSTGVVNSGRPFVQGINGSTGACEAPDAMVVGPYLWVATNIGLLATGEIITWGGIPAAPALPPSLYYTQVRRGLGFYVAVRADNQLVVWGTTNAHGQLNPPQLPAGVPIVKVDVGLDFGLVLLADGTIHGWGRNDLGQINVPQLSFGMSYVDVNAGEQHSVAVRNDGEAVAWGSNLDGQLNVPVRPAGTSYLLAAAGASTCVAFRSDGEWVVWGNTWTTLTAPPPVPPGVYPLSLDCGAAHAVALLSDNTVQDWGYLGTMPALPEGPGGQLTATFTDLSTHTFLRSDGRLVDWRAGYPPPPFDQQTFTCVDADFRPVVALRTDGQVIAFGDSNNYGELNVPTLPAGMVYTDVVAGPNFAIAMRSDGNAVAWGRNQYGEGSIPPLPSGMHYVRADAAYLSSVLLRSDQTVFYGGYADIYQYQLSEPLLPPGVRWVQLALNEVYVAGLRSDGQVELWGNLSSSSSIWRNVPALPFGVRYVEVASGAANTMLRRSDGLVEACGLVGSREHVVPPLDQGTTYHRIAYSFNYTSPIAIVGPESRYTSFAAGCAGSLPPSRLVPRDTPMIGHVLEITVFDLPFGYAMMTMGFQRLTAPVDLGFLGMPGCDAHIAMEGVALLTGQNGNATWSLPIPDDALLIGVHFYNQALVLDPNASNGFGAVVSEAAEGVVGRL